MSAMFSPLIVPSPPLPRLLGEPLQPRDLEGESVVGHQAARPRPEHLVRLAAEILARIDLGVLVKPWFEHDVELTVRVGHAPRRERLVPVVFPRELVAELVQPAVDDQPVLGEAGAGRPLRPELESHDVLAAASRAAAPVPVDPRWPASAADVEHAPRVAVRAADLVVL